MRSTKRHLRVGILTLAFLSMFGGLEARADTSKPDPGAPDSIWIASVPWRGDTVLALDVYAATDESLVVAQIVLAWPNAALRIDSVKLNVGRWAVVGYHQWAQAGIDTAVALAFLPTQGRLPPGSGPVARIFCGRDSAYAFDTDLDLDTSQIDNPPPLAPYQTVFSEAANDPFLPTLISPGTVFFSPCICKSHGDPVADGGIDAVDLANMIDGIFFGGPLPDAEPTCPHIHRGDFNCDNTYDVLDLSRLIDHIFFGGVGPCDPCTDL